MARVIISAGHTNQEPGTVLSGVREVDLTRKIAHEVTKKLRDNDVITLAVPPDLDLSRRIQWINQTGYHEASKDIAIEIHINEGRKSGMEGWYQADKLDSQKLTIAILEQVHKSTDWPSQGVKSEYEHELGSLVFLHNTNPIASLIECGFMDNPKDMELLQSAEGIDKLATGITKGIMQFLGLSPKEKEVANDKPQTQPVKEEPVEVKAQPVQTPQVVQPNPVTVPAPAVAPAPIPSFSNPVSGVQNPTPMTGGFGGYNPPSFSNTSGFGPRPGGIGATGFGTNTMSPSGMSPAPYMDREQRKEMIKKNYVKILGREPSPSDSNYFLNIGINEEQLIRKMVDSQEHADLVKARQEVITTKQKFVEQNNELLRLRAKVNDQKGIIKNLNILLMQKNKAIFMLQQKVQMIALSRANPPKPAPKPTYKKTFSQRMLDYFSSKLG